MRKIPFKVGDQEFESVKAAAEHFRIPVMTLGRRLRTGWSPAQSVGLEPHARPTWADTRDTSGVVLHTSAGTFPNIEVAARHFSLKPATLAARIRTGWTHDEAVGLVPRKRPQKQTTTVQCAGIVYPNVEALAAAYELAYTMVYKRLRSGWTPEQAVNLGEAPPRFRDQVGGARTHHWRSVEYVDDRILPGGDVGEFKLYVIRNQLNGKEYVGITVTPLLARLRGHRATAAKGVKTKLYNAMRHYGQEHFTIELLRNDAKSFSELQHQEADEIARRRTLVSGYNVSPGGAIGTPTAVTVGTHAFSSRSAAAAHFGIDPSVFNLRISRLGWSPEEAAEIAPRRAYARHKISVGDLAFTSLKAAAEHFGLSYKMVHRRVAVIGWSVEEALGVAPRPRIG